MEQRSVENKKEQLAHLRALHATNQCELTFHLTDTINGLYFDEDVKAVRQITDTVGSLLSHIRNKLNREIKKIKENEIENESFIIPLSLKHDAELISEDTVLKTLIQHERINIFEILSQKFKVTVNAPLVQLISLPVVMYASSMVEPTRCKILYAKRDMSEFQWFRSADKQNWSIVGTKYAYRIKKDDVNNYLKFRCIPKRRNICGSAYEVVSIDTVKAVPTIPKCPFEERHKYTPRKLTGKEFRVVSYNTLSSRYVETNEQFPYCHNRFLAIDYRKHLLYNEIAGYKADVICLQEVDSKEYLHFFQSKFKKLGYESVFHRKGFKITEGLCCIYNDAKFKAINSLQLVFSNELKKNYIFRDIKNSLKKGSHIQDIFLKQHTSLQITVLQSKILKEILIVANTHLYYHWEAGHVRMIQIMMATKFLEHWKKRFEQEYGTRVSVIFCGDFNSGPTSGVYQYMTRGKLDDEHEDRSKVLDENKDVSHSFQFGSACGTPEFTNYTVDFKGCLDYIFYDKQSIGLIRSIPFLSEDILSDNVALPSEVFPSDHIALVADLQFL